MSKYHELPTAFLWPLNGLSLLVASLIVLVLTALPWRPPVMSYWATVYSLLDGMTSDRACVGPVECGVWRWGFATISCLVENTGADGWCGKPRGFIRKGCGLE